MCVVARERERAIARKKKREIEKERAQADRKKETIGRIKRPMFYASPKRSPRVNMFENRTISNKGKKSRKFTCSEGGKSKLNTIKNIFPLRV